MSASRDSILSIEPTSIPEPEPAKIRKSIPCSSCGENVMESRINQLGGKPTCIQCFEKHIGT
jgi:formylmethanofuran dehydrogenase subunit E